MKTLAKRLIGMTAAAVMLTGSLTMNVSAGSVGRADTVTTITVNEEITNEATIYYTDIYTVGKGAGYGFETYLYSDDFIVTQGTIDELKASLGSWNDAAALLPEDATVLMTDEEKAMANPMHTGLALSTTDQDKMDAGWKDGEATAKKLFPDAEMTSNTLYLRDDTKVEGAANYYDTWNGSSFSYYIDYEQDTDRKEQLGDNYFPSDKRLLSHIGSKSVDTTGFTMIDGVLVKHVDTVVTFYCQATTIIYSCIELNTTPNAELTVNFYANDKLYNTQTVKSGEKVTIPDAPPCTEPGKQFLYWLTSLDPEMAAVPDLDYPIYNDMNLYAYFGKPWTPIQTYNFTLNTDDDSLKPEMTEFTYKNDTTERSAWYFDGNYSVPYDLEDGDYTLTVSADNFAARSYKVTVEGGNLTEDPNVTLNLIGDVDGNKKVNNSDLLLVKSHIKGIKKLTGYELECANADGDTAKKINNSDLLVMKSHIKNIKKLWTTFDHSVS